MAFRYLNGACIDDNILTRYKSGKGNEELITIPEGVTEIGESAFSGESFKNIILNVEKVGDYAFNYCHNLKGVTLCEGLRELGKWAFNSCKRIAAIHIPSTLIKMDRKEQPFNNCSNLKSITVEDGNPVYHAKNNCLIETKAKILLCGCSTSVIPKDGSVAVIGKGAFVRQFALASIDIPDSVTKIGELAFLLCNSLSKVVIPDSVKTIGASAFEGSGIKVLRLGSGVETIGAGAFTSCPYLTEATVPDNVKSIGGRIFANSGLKSVKLGKGIKTVPDAAFRNCENLTEAILPEGLVSIEKNAFRNCCTLEKICIPASVTYIGAGAFQSCRKLKDVIIENENTVIAEDAFTNCAYQPPKVETNTDFELNGASLIKYKGSNKQISIPQSVTKIADKAFKNSAVEEIFIHAGVTAISVHAFENCENLRTLEIEKANKKFRSEGNCIINKKTGTVACGCAGSVIAFKFCRGLKSVHIPASVERIETDAFLNCYELEEVTSEEGLEFIGHHAFKNCKNLKSVTLARGLKTIDSGAFESCKKLRYLSLPEGLETIKQAAFYECTELEEIYLPDGLAYLANVAFNKCTNVKSIRLPASLIKIEYNAFSSGPHLESITVEEGNPMFSGKGNCLTEFSTRFREPDYQLICGCKNSVIPADLDIKVINDAFEGCSTLEELDIPEGVEFVYGNAFGGCTGLKRLSIPESFRHIEVFGDCTALESVTAPEIARSYFEKLNKNIVFTPKK